MDSLVEKVDLINDAVTIVKVLYEDPENILPLLSTLSDLVKNINTRSENIIKLHKTIYENQDKLESLRDETIANQDRINELEALYNERENLTSSFDYNESENGSVQSPTNEEPKNVLDKEEIPFNVNDNGNTDNHQHNYLTPGENFETRTSKPSRISPMKLFNDMENLTNEEFLNIPRYLLGRTSLEIINIFIGKINLAINKKYTLLAKRKSQVKHFELTRYNTYKTLMNEIKGETFISEQDLTEILNLKILDKKSINLITILRNVQRIREIKLKNMMKQFVIL